MSESRATIFAGLSRVTYVGEPLDLGHGIVLRSTYAHLFAANMMAFTRAPEGRPHPPPWRDAGGGFGYDIEVELAVPTAGKLPGGLSAEDAIWLIAALLRLSQYSYLMVPVISDVPFDAAARSEREPLLQPFEVEPRIFHPGDEEIARLSVETLSWIKDVWPRTAELLRTCPPLNLALRAADACTVRGRPASALLTAWGALEELFAPSRAELRFRVSAHIAAYLEPAGPERLETFKTVANLYNARSKAAHMRRRAEANVIGGFLLIGWGGDPDADPPEQLVTSAELREILVESDDDLRGQILWHLEHWYADPEGKWRARLIPFLSEVWPNHRAVRTPEMSARLVDLALASGDLFPQVVQAILPRLVPVRGGMLRGFMLRSEAENHPALIYPAAMLDLLWAILAEDATLWPYKIEEILDVLAEAPETRADPRLSELRRRRAG